MLYHPLFQDVYCSQQDGLAEKRYVFLRGNRLPLRWESALQKPFVMAETGFGMGLNFLATWQAWERSNPVCSALHYISIEKELLSPTAIEQVGTCWPELMPYSARLLSHYSDAFSGRVTIQLTPTFTFILLAGDIHAMLPLIGSGVDAWCLDGFAPAKNPDMWGDGLFDYMASHTAAGGTVATYTAASQVRKGLERAGFHVQKVPGYGRKREMLVGEFATLHCNHK